MSMNRTLKFVLLLALLALMAACIVSAAADDSSEGKVVDSSNIIDDSDGAGSVSVECGGIPHCNACSMSQGAYKCGECATGYRLVSNQCYRASGAAGTLPCVVAVFVAAIAAVMTFVA